MMIDHIRRRHVWLMKNTLQTIGHILATVSPEEARTWRDGEDGWTILEILCHLRDFDGFFKHRAIMMIDQENPHLPAYDHEALAVERRYNEQSLEQVWQDFQTGRAEFRDLFKRLTEKQWARTGIHPERGPFSMDDALLQVGLHDCNHIEQITRIIAEARS